jgi:Fe-S cluster biogenesis protein NfuA
MIRSALKSVVRKAFGMESAEAPPPTAARSGPPPSWKDPATAKAPPPGAEALAAPEPAPAPVPEAAVAATPVVEAVAPVVEAPPPAATAPAPMAPTDDTAGPALNFDKVQELMDEMVRPALQGDGGDITLLKVENNDVYVKLVGSCSTCPSSIMTMKMGVEALLKEEFPGMGSLIQVD